ncbi:sulfatase family protein [Lacipirellula limnantheis]|uniref:Choline-sulfatase n=1 Tax=Lacipirellula limnantheis TaxID=2528024 RepID=A0A517TRU7_9BACT|nr:sulfatase [Lacipirellula limnantheis]QDT71102.1 Choline-sulfatase [Lacipirellula limnantheis]
MRSFLSETTCLFVVLVVSPWFNSANAQAETARPNFVFIIADDVSPDDLPCYAPSPVKAPHLDRLAAEGRVFDRAYLTTSSCSPTRCSIITGRYPHNTGAPELHLPLPAGQFMFPQALRAAGYFTVLSGKNHLGPNIFTAFDQISPGRGPGKEGDWVRQLRERPQDKPFFMWLASTDAHRPWQTSEQDPVYDPASAVVPPFLVDGPQTREDLAAYYHEISRLDRFVGKVVDELQRQGIAENTYVIFTADNGRPFPRCKTRLYDSGVKTPLIVWRPGTIKPGRTGALASVIDLAPTILQLAGLPIDPRVQGVSLEPLLANPQATVRDVAFSEHNWHVGQAHERSVRDGRWLYIRNAYPALQSLCVESGPQEPAGRELWMVYAAGTLKPEQGDVFLQPRPAEELYDVEADPHQLRNLLGKSEATEEMAAVHARLQQALDQWVAETGDAVPTNPTPGANVVGRGQGMGREFRHRELPGESRNASSLNAPGPIRLSTP